jgi:hypothetical protein
MEQIEKHFRKVLAQPQGSRYYKADLHIHTPSSKDARGSKRYDYSHDDALDDREAGFPKAREIADQIVEKLVEERIQVAAFTDHNSPSYVDNANFSSPSWYHLVTEAYQQRRAADPDHPRLLLLPGVEITTDRIHILGIFDNEDPHAIFKIASLLRAVDIREHEFGEVDGVFGTKSIWEVADAIDELGGICIPAHINATSSRSLLGQYEPPDMEIERLVQHHAIHVFGVVPTSKPWPDHRTYQSVIANKNFKRRGGAKVGYHDWMVNKRAQVPQHLPALGYMMNSDAHSIAKIGERFSWVKMDDLSFRALSTALRNPYYTVARNHLEPESPVCSQVLGLSMEGGFADGIVIRFHENFNCVVGHPSSGKTTLMRVISDTYWGKRLGLRMRDETERAMDKLAPGLWDEIRGSETFTQAGQLRAKIPDDVRQGFEAGFLETHRLPWTLYLFFAQVEEDSSKTVYVAERSRPTEGIDADGKEDVFRYYRSQPLPADLDAAAQIDFSEIGEREFRRSLARPGFYFGRIGLGSPDDDFFSARRLLDRHVLSVMDGYDDARRRLFGLCNGLEEAAEKDPPDSAAIKALTTEVRQHLEALLALKKEFARSFNETEREHALRVAFRKGRWGELVANVPKPAQVEKFARGVRRSLHGQDYYDPLDLTFYQKKRRGDGWDEVPYEELTPGRRGLMALRLLLNSSREMAPVFIDAPERWLDNESLLEFYDLRRIRDDQLVLFTENPNIAVLGNAEQNIILDQDKGVTRAPCAGGLDDHRIAREIIRLLEGGRTAFERKLLRYNSELAEDGLRIELHRV